MKALFYIALFLFTSFFSYGQYIKNGDMEDTVLTNFYGRTCYPKYWETVDGASHIISLNQECVSRDSKLEPLLEKAFNKEKTLFISNNHGHLYGETVGQELSKELIKDIEYKVSFTTCFTNQNLPSGRPNNRKPLLITSLNKEKPETYTDINGLYNDTLKIPNEKRWVSHSFCFTPQDTGIKFISFSNFNISDNLYADILIDNVKIEAIPYKLDLGNDTSLCKGDTLKFDIANDHSDNYFWHGWSVAPSFDSKYEITKSGTYWAGIQTPCSIETDTIEIFDTEPPYFSFDLNTDSTFCIGEKIELKASYPKAKYLWQDNSTDSNYTVTKEGTYWVQITDQCDSSVSDTVNIDYHEPLLIDLGNDRILCKGDSTTLYIPDTNLSYVWQDKSTKYYYVLNEQGKYWVDVTNECESVNDTIIITTPNSPSIDSLKHLNSYYFTVKDNIFDQYQWIYCDSTPIPNANSPTLTVSSSGNYSLITEKNSCLDTSNCITVGLSEIKEDELKLYPNPSRQYIFIDYSGSFNRMTIVVRNVLGQLIQQKEFIRNNEISQLELFGSSGTYNFEVQIDDRKPEFFSIVKQ